MDMEERAKLEQFYLERTDEEIKQFMLDGENCFQEGAYELIRAEARRRRIDDGVISEFKDKAAIHAMARGAILELLSGRKLPSGINEDLLYSEAFRRKISWEEVSQFRDFKNKINNPESSEPSTTVTSPLDLVQLISFDNVNDEKAFADALTKAGINFTLQIMVDQNDFEKADAATRVIDLNKIGQ